MHKLGAMVRRRAPLSLRLRRARGELLIPFRRDPPVCGHRCRRPRHLPHSPPGHGLPQVLPLSATQAAAAQATEEAAASGTYIHTHRIFVCTDIKPIIGIKYIDLSN